MRREIKYLSTQLFTLEKFHEEFQFQLNKFQNQVTETTQLLHQKCDQEECRKNSKKLRKLQRNFNKMNKSMSEELQNLETNKCSRADCHNLETEVSDIMIKVDSLNNTFSTNYEQSGNVSELTELLYKINETYCSKETCQTVIDDVDTIKEDISAINTNISTIISTKCDSTVCMKSSAEIANFAKITEALYTSQEEIFSEIKELDSRKCEQETCLEHVVKVDNIISSQRQLLIAFQELENNVDSKCEQETCDNLATEHNGLVETVKILEAEMMSKCEQETCDDINTKLETVQSDLTMKCDNEVCEKITEKQENLSESIKALESTMTSKCDKDTCDDFSMMIKTVGSELKKKCDNEVCDKISKDQEDLSGSVKVIKTEQDDFIGRLAVLETDLSSKCDLTVCQQTEEKLKSLEDQSCSVDYCENTSIGLSNVNTVVREGFKNKNKISN